MIEYINLAAVLWLTGNTLATVSQINNNIGRKVERMNLTPFVLSIVSLIILGIEATKDIFP